MFPLILTVLNKDYSTPPLRTVSIRGTSKGGAFKEKIDNHTMGLQTWYPRSLSTKFFAGDQYYPIRGLK